MVDLRHRRLNRGQRLYRCCAAVARIDCCRVDKAALVEDRDAVQDKAAAQVQGAARDRAGALDPDVALDMGVAPAMVAVQDAVRALDRGADQDDTAQDSAANYAGRAMDAALDTVQAASVQALAKNAVRVPATAAARMAPTDEDQASVVAALVPR